MNEYARYVWTEPSQDCAAAEAAAKKAEQCHIREQPKIYHVALFLLFNCEKDQISGEILEYLHVFSSQTRRCDGMIALFDSQQASVLRGRERAFGNRRVFVDVVILAQVQAEMLQTGCGEESADPYCIKSVPLQV